MTPGVERIAIERDRQINGEGWDRAHDRGRAEELALAAACYAIRDLERRAVRGTGYVSTTIDLVGILWPWARQWWKPASDRSREGRIRELEKAGALVAAALDDLLAEGD